MILRGFLDRIVNSIRWAPDDDSGAADEGPLFADASGQQGTTVSTADPPAQPATPQVTPEAPIAGASVTPDAAATASAAASPSPAQAAFDARAYAEAQGWQGARQQWVNDEQFVRDLMAETARARQLSQLEPYAQEYLQHRDNFTKWQAEQQRAQAQQQPRKLYEAPEWKPEWAQLLTKDDKGNLNLAPGADPAILAKYHAHARWRADFAEKLTTDPEGVLAPLVEQRATQIVEKVLQEKFAQQDAANSQKQYLAQQASWMVAKDQAGNPIRNPATGLPVLTQAGQIYEQHYVSANKLGMSPQAAFAYAEAQTMNALLVDQFKQLQAGNTGEAAKKQALEAGRTHNRVFNADGSPIVGGQAPSNTSMSLRDQLLAKTSNLTDSHFASVQ